MNKYVVGALCALMVGTSVFGCTEVYNPCAPEYIYPLDEDWDEDWEEDYDYCVADYPRQTYQVCNGGSVMAHWANLRDDCGNVIGTVDAGSSVQILGQCPDNPSRTIIYDYTTGCYGTVASVYLYGGTCYEYEHPTEYGGCGSQGEYYYEQDSEETCPDESAYEYEPDIIPAQYDETTPWACDRLEYDGYPVYEDAEYYDDDEDCEGYFSFYDEGEIWVDVDISAQVVNVYCGTTVILSGDCVTGTAGMTDTPCGQYTIYSKEQNTVLTGENYRRPVDYWMPFCGGCGFHDANWRSDFGGDIYETSGSLGCVNLDPCFAEEMYEICPEGCTVNIH